MMYAQSNLFRWGCRTTGSFVGLSVCIWLASPVLAGYYYTYLYVKANDDFYITPEDETDKYSNSQTAFDAGSGFFSEAKASFDLYTGKMKFEANSSGYDPVNRIGSDVDVSLVVKDEVYPVWETPPLGGDMNSPMEITLTWEAQGDYTYSASSPYDIADLSSAFAYGVDVNPTAPTTWTWNNYFGLDRQNLTDGYEYWEQTFTFFPEFNTSIFLYQTLFADFETYDPSSYYFADFWNTATVDVSLPEGAAMTSASGVLLTGQEIPEPATLLLLGLAMVQLISSARWPRI